MWVERGANYKEEVESKEVAKEEWRWEGRNEETVTVNCDTILLLRWSGTAPQYSMEVKIIKVVMTRKWRLVCSCARWRTTNLTSNQLLAESLNWWLEWCRRRRWCAPNPVTRVLWNRCHLSRFLSCDFLASLSTRESSFTLCIFSHFSPLSPLSHSPPPNSALHSASYSSLLLFTLIRQQIWLVHSTCQRRQRFFDLFWP